MPSHGLYQEPLISNPVTTVIAGQVQPTYKNNRRTTGLSVIWRRREGNVFGSPSIFSPEEGGMRDGRARSTAAPFTRWRPTTAATRPRSRVSSRVFGPCDFNIGAQTTVASIPRTYYYDVRTTLPLAPGPVDSASTGPPATVRVQPATDLAIFSCTRVLCTVNVFSFFFFLFFFQTAVHATVMQTVKTTLSSSRFLSF